MVIPEMVEYQGRPILQLKAKEDDKYPFSFGMVKAKLILEAMPAIQQFVEKNDKPKAEVTK